MIMSICCCSSALYVKATGYVGFTYFIIKCPIICNFSLVMIIHLKLKYPGIKCGYQGIDCAGSKICYGLSYFCISLIMLNDQNVSANPLSP